MKGLVVPLATLSLLVLAEATANAQITQEKGTRAEERSDSAPDFEATNDTNGNWSIEFEKEAIDATLNDGTIPRILVLPVHGFGLLTRPRTHFVPELLKSVELM